MADGQLPVVEELSCSVCLGAFKEPKVLPCCHSFCLHCLEGAHDKTKDHLTCPQCRTQHQVPASGVCGFLTDYTLLSPKSCDSDHPLQPCEQCEDGGRGVAYCVTCSDYLCTDCLQGHKKYKPLRQHEIVDLREEGGGESSSNGIGTRAVYSCSIHVNEPLRLHCQTCQALVCLHCFVLLHNGHDIGNIDTKRRKGLEKTIKELIRDTRLRLKEFEGNLQYIKAVEKEKTNEAAPIKEEINKKFDFIIAQLETRRRQLLKDADDAHSKDVKELWGQREYHETSITQMRGALSFAKRSLACEEHIQLFAVSPQVTARLKQLSQQKWDCQSTERLEMTSLHFGSSKVEDSHAPVIVFKALGAVHRTIAPPALDIMSKNIPSSVRVGSLVELHIKATLRLYGRDLLKRAYGYVHVIAAATVQRKEQSEKANAQVYQDGDDLWTIQFTPLHKGTYSICIEARAAYGLQAVSNKYRCDMLAI